MKRLGLCVLPFAGMLLSACGGGETGTGGQGGSGGAGGGPTTTTSVTSTTSTGVTTTSTGTGGSVPGCAGGVEFTFGEAVVGSLDEPGQEDYYRFDGVKGQVLWIDIDAQDLDQVSFDPTYIDAVVTVYNDKEEKVAQNNDPLEFSTADSRLYTILPEDGTYCIRVAECWTALSNPGANCLAPEEKDVGYYELNVFELIDDGPGDSNTADPEAGNDPASAVDVDFVPAQNGGYFTAYIWGYYEDDMDVDVFTFTLPADVPVEAGARAHAVLRAFPSGTLASGSTNPTGELWIVDPADPAIPFATIDPGSSTELNVPLALDKEYWLFVHRAPGTVDVNDFYFLSQYPGWGNPLEVDDAGNTDIATAEALSFSDADSAFIEGDLIPITDLDHFRVDVPPGMTMVTGVCGARTRGSGLRQMKMSLLGDDGMLLSDAADDIETASQLAYVQDIPVGANTSVVLKIESPMLAAEATSAFYQCGVHFSN
jgi:hypothetical protein